MQTLFSFFWIQIRMSCEDLGHRIFPWFGKKLMKLCTWLLKNINRNSLAKTEVNRVFGKSQNLLISHHWSLMHLSQFKASANVNLHNTLHTWRNTETYLQRWPELFIYLLALIFYSPFCSFSLEGSTVGGALNGLKRLEGFQVSREGERVREGMWIIDQRWKRGGRECWGTWRVRDAEERKLI